MLKSLTIENYAIIQEINIAFDESLNIITGETGAGKSILMGALSLVMGQRADTSVLYDKERKCIVEAHFTDYPSEIDDWLESNDFDKEQDLIIRREIASSGKSRAFINDSPSKLNALQELATTLIDLNSQFDVRALHQTDFQLRIIDALADNKSILEKYQQLYKKYKSDIKELESLKSKEAAVLREAEFNRFLLEELHTAAIEADEQTALESEQKILSKAESISSLLEESRFILDGSEQSVRDQLQSLLFKWQNYDDIEEAISNFNEGLNNTVDAINELMDKLDILGNKLESDPGRLEEIEDRLDVMYKLFKKHNVNTSQELLDIQTTLEKSSADYESSRERVEELEKLIEASEKQLDLLASELSASRANVFTDLESAVNDKLDLLAMPAAEIKVKHSKSSELMASGRDEIDILFRANVGTDFQSVKKVASGGESSRLMLAVKATIAQNMELPTMIFDEIDSGVSGEVALKMGTLLKELSRSHQLICITHSPQVAARAVKHFFVYKEIENDRTFTHVKQLESEERIVEVAKMLSGDPPSTFALENARELIKA